MPRRIIYFSCLFNHGVKPRNANFLEFRESKHQMIVFMSGCFFIKQTTANSSKLLSAFNERICPIFIYCNAIKPNQCFNRSLQYINYCNKQVLNIKSSRLKCSIFENIWPTKF